MLKILSDRSNNFPDHDAIVVVLWSNIEFCYFWGRRLKLLDILASALVSPSIIPVPKGIGPMDLYLKDGFRYSCSEFSALKNCTHFQSTSAFSRSFTRIQQELASPGLSALLLGRLAYLLSRLRLGREADGFPIRTLMDQGIYASRKHSTSKHHRDALLTRN